MWCPSSLPSIPPLALSPMHLCPSSLPLFILSCSFLYPATFTRPTPPHPEPLPLSPFLLPQSLPSPTPLSLPQLPAAFPSSWVHSPADPGLLDCSLCFRTCLEVWTFLCLIIPTPESQVCLLEATESHFLCPLTGSPRCRLLVGELQQCSAITCFKEKTVPSMLCFLCVFLCAAAS